MNFGINAGGLPCLDKPFKIAACFYHMRRARRLPALNSLWSTVNVNDADFVE
jgi:hypothetical protein